MSTRAALVGLLRGTYAGRPAVLRQRIIEGEDPRRIAADHNISIGDAEAQILEWEAQGNRLTTWADDDYPTQLRDVHDFPIVLFVRGTLKQEDLGACIVGSRDASPEALAAAAEVAEHISRERFTVISGLARGIDYVAHSAALATNGRTVGVVGTGIDRYSPASSRDLQKQIEEQGLVISQFWPGTSGNLTTFPMRNAVMSAYGGVTIILAAGEKSGTRHQASQALAHGRPLVLSRSVATKTSWGRRFSQQEHSDVSIASSSVEAAEKALDLMSNSKRTSLISLF